LDSESLEDPSAQEMESNSSESKQKPTPNPPNPFDPTPSAPPIWEEQKVAPPLAPPVPSVPPYDPPVPPAPYDPPVPPIPNIPPDNCSLEDRSSSYHGMGIPQKATIGATAAGVAGVVLKATWEVYKKLNPVWQFYNSLKGRQIRWEV